ncbi:MAG: glycosyltransferase 61 family protein, partial [Muribaculaceae bacterium]|nr:glycosyltransferase 61 family protein [Muribaculaceae bacterium]
FISESLARIWALNQPEIDEDSKILFFSDSTSLGMPGGNFRQVFELLGIADRIIIADKEILAEELTVPDLSYEHDVFYTKEQSHVYRKIISKALESQPSAEIKYAKKVFISRAGIPGAVKNAVNLMELEQYFKDNGFATISPEQISLIDLIHIMDSADTIASIGGTPAHNFVFVNRPDSKHLIIIERHPCVNDFQISLNKMTGCQTINVDAFYLPKAASSQDGIMLFAPTPQFCEFAANLNFIKEGHFVDDAKRQRRRELRKFLSRYRRYWCSGDALCPWEIYSGQAIAEAMVASRERYREWLQDSLPIMWYDYLTPRALLRMVISYLRKKL